MKKQKVQPEGEAVGPEPVKEENPKVQKSLISQFVALVFGLLLGYTTDLTSLLIAAVRMIPLICIGHFLVGLPLLPLSFVLIVTCWMFKYK